MNDVQVVIALDDTDLDETAAAVRTDDHRHPASRVEQVDVVAQRVLDRVLGDAVPVGAVENDRLAVRASKLPCSSVRDKQRASALVARTDDNRSSWPNVW